jgi:RimJ/RimL family protein N-acetyltransferase
MPEDVRFVSAATLSLEGLAALFTRSFEGYYYAGTTSAEALAERVRVEQIDLWGSPVLLAGGEPAGVALLARRGERAWCGGFGVVASQRGRGLSHDLAAALIARARAAGAGLLSLEVLTRNERALHTYRRAGMRVARRLLVLSWQPGEGDPPDPPALAELPPAELLGHFAALHPAPAAWQRDQAGLIAASGLRGLALPGANGPLAYALLRGDQAGMRLADLGARDADAAHRLLLGLQARTRSLLSVNEPAESPLTGAFYRAGFILADDQYELELALH